MKLAACYQPLYKFVSILVLVSLAFSNVGMLGTTVAHAQEDTPEMPTPGPQCFTLEPEVVGGEGELLVLTPQNCAGGYLVDTSVELLGVPARGFIVQSWQGTDHDSDLSTSNFITISSNSSISVAFTSDSTVVTDAIGPLALVTLSGKVTSRRWPYEGVEGVTVSLDTGQSAVTAWDGTYTIASVSTGTRTVTATKSDWFATGTSASETKTVSVTANTTVNFTQFACKATASASISLSKSTVTPGETFNVTVSLKNTNYAVSSVKAFLDLSFSDTRFTVGTPTGTGWTNIYKYPVGSTLWGVQSNGTPYQLTSTNYLVSSERLNTSFGYNTTYSFTVPITVKSTATPGTVTLYYRGTIGDERDPDSTGSGTRDQQGWNASTTTVTVNPPFAVTSATAKINNSTGPVNITTLDSVTRSGTISGTGDGTVTYHWEHKPAASSSWTSTSNYSTTMTGGSATVSASSTSNPGEGSWDYRIAVTGPSSVYSNTVRVNITLPAPGTVGGTVKSRQWPYPVVSVVSVNADTGQSATTGSNGTYTLLNVPAGSRTITSSRTDWWATGTSSSASKTVTVTSNSSTAADFSDFTVKATPQATISVDKANVVPGETFNVTVTLTNTNYAITGKAFLDLSFSGDKVTLGTISSNGYWTGGSGIITYPPGSSNVYGVTSAGVFYNLSPSQVVDHLVSAERSGTVHFNTPYTFTVPLTVKPGATPGPITFKYRGTIEDKHDPVSSGAGTLDQQGWNVSTATVNVTTLPLDILGIGVTPTNPTVAIGDSFTVRYQINNPNSINQSIYLLARSRTSAGAYAFLKDSTGNSYSARTIVPGTAWYEWQVKVYDGAPAGSGYSLTGFLSPTTNWSDYVDSANLNNAFTVVAPQPELTVYQSSTNTIPYKWRSVNFKLTSGDTAKSYDIWTIIDSGKSIPATKPLSEYITADRGKIYSIYVIDTATNTNVNQELATLILLDTENQLLLANMTITAAIPAAYQATATFTRNDNSGATYQVGKSLVTSTIPDILLYRGVKGLDVPSARKEIYKNMLLELILNQEMSNSDLFEDLSYHLGFESDEYKKLALAVEAHEISKSATDPYFKSIEEVEASINAAILKENLNKASEVLEAMGEGVKISGEVYEAILMQSLADAKAEQRLQALKQVINSNSLPGQDYLLMDALVEAETEFYQIKNIHHQAFLSAATDGSTLQNIDNFYSAIRTFVYPLIKKGLTSTVQQFLTNHPSLNTFLKKGKPYAFALSVMWDNFVTIDGKLHLLRQADLSIALSYQMEVYLRNHQSFPSTITDAQTHNLLMLNEMRQYLAYLHFHRLGQVLDGKLYDVFLLDVVDGLLGFYAAFYPDYQTAREDYEDQENRALNNYANFAPPYFLLNVNDKFAPLINALNSNASTNLIAAQTEYSTVAGREVTLLFRLKNTGPVAGIYSISVSMDNGLTVTQPPTSNAIWTRYEIGTPIYYKDGTPNPRPSNKLLYEATGTLPAGGQVEVSLTVSKTIAGNFDLYYRAAMRAQNAANLNENYTRDPGSGTITDQQGWPAKTIRFSLPQPVVTSSLSSLQLELGSTQAINFTLKNNGGSAAPAYIDVSVSSGLEIVEMYPVYAWDCYPPGSNIWHAGETDPRPSQYLLCSSVQSRMASQETRSFTIVVRSTSLSSQWIKYRAAMNPADSPTSTIPDSFVRDPSSGAVDQQGWPAYTIPVSVWENHPPTIASYTPNQATVNATVGQTINFSVVAQDQDPQSTLSYVWLWDNYTFLGNGSSIQWTADLTKIGEHTIAVVIWDGELFVTQKWTVIVEPINQVPTLIWTGETNYASDGLHPESGGTTDNYLYRIKYSDADGNAPNFVHLYIEKGGVNITGSPFIMSCSGTTYTTGVICNYTKTNLAAGTDYTYYFTAQDSQGGNATQTAELDAPDVSAINTNPVLSWTGETNYTSDGLHPESGSTGDSYLYKIKYSDTDGNAPNYVRLYIEKGGVNVSGSPFTMSCSGVTYTSGVICSYTKSGLAAGTDYTYYFTAQDSQGGGATQTAKLDAPDVSAINNNPILSWTGETNYASDGLHPESGGTADSYLYRIKYSDADGNAPNYVRLYIEKGGVNIAGSPFTMNCLGTTYATGIICTYTKSGLTVGTDYTYYVTAQDNQGGNATPTAELDAPDVSAVNNNPSLTWTGETNYASDGLNPESGNTSDNYVYRIKYTDADGHAPGFVRVYIKENGTNISGSPFTMTCSGTSYSTGVICSYTKSGLSAGTNYTYYFTAQDSQGGNATPTAELNAPDVSAINTNPVLSWTGETNYISDGLDPETGYPSTSYTYKVKYSDADGNAPNYVRLYIKKGGTNISGSPFTMSCLGTTYTTGVICSYTTTSLTAGTDYTYYFTAQDSQGGNATPTAELNAPDVSSVNNDPVLSWTGETDYISDGLHPESGGTTDSYLYRIKYSDADGNAPGHVRLYIEKGGVNITGSPFTMSCSGSAYTTGVICSYTKAGLAPGADYTYYFTAQDIQGGNAVQTSELDAPDVTTSVETLYLTEVQGLLRTVNQSTGATTLIGTLGSTGSVGGLAARPGESGYLYAIDATSGAGTNSRLIKVSVSTGAGTLMPWFSEATLGVSQPFATAIAISPKNTNVAVVAGFNADSTSPYYGWDYIWKVDLQSGSVLGAAIPTTNNIQSLVYSLDGSILYGTDGLGRLVSVNETNGTLTVIGDPGLSDWIEGLAFRPSDGALFAIDAYTADRLIELNPANGSLIRVVGSLGVAGPNGLAFSGVQAVDTPEMDVRGNTISIQDGDSTPSAVDYTDFGSVDVNSGSVEHDFFVHNFGSADLILSDITQIFLPESGFSVTVLPASIVPPGGFTKFTVKYNPSMAGLSTVNMTIMNNDADENPYNFVIQGTGTQLLDSYEPDNTSAQATILNPGVTQTHNLIPATDMDWVKFELTKSSAVTLETNGATQSDTHIWLYGSNLVPIEDDDDDGTGYYSFIDRLCNVDALPAGTYYAKIDEQGNNNEIPSYSLSLTTQACSVVSTPTFEDVPVTHPYYQDIEILYANHLTSGCQLSPLKFCPDKIMNRAEAAAFNLRANFGPSYVPPAATHIFVDDWSKGLWAEPWAEGMKLNGYSAGCQVNPPKYCPWDQIPREQAVIFALKIKYGKDYTPPPATGTLFADMTNTSFYATAWAEQAYREGLIPNCGMSGGKPKICPKTLVSRGLAAYMIVRAKNLSLP